MISECPFDMSISLWTHQDELDYEIALQNALTDEIAEMNCEKA